MGIPASKNKIHNYVLKSHLAYPKKDQAIFKIKTLNARKFQKVVSLCEIAEDKKVGIEKINSAAVEVFKFSLKGWSNLYDDEDKKVEYSYKEMSRILDCISFAEVCELMEQVLKQNTLNEKQVKN